MGNGASASTVLTLALDEALQARFEAQRQKHYPPALNRIPAHLTLFHTLPANEEVAHALQSIARQTPAFPLQVSGLKSLGRGVAYFLTGVEATVLHRRLADAFEPWLSRQDRQGFRPHVVVQNKASASEVKRVFQELSAEFAPWPVQAVGLDWWDYLGGPWQLRQRFRFG